MRINSMASVMNRFGEKYTDDQIKNEPMFFRATIKYAMDNGGPITKSFLSTLLEEEDTYLDKSNALFDSRSHMLMKNFYPCIPGWHHDLVPRSREDGQPNYKNPEFHSVHCLGLINGEIAPTEFAVGNQEFEEVPLGENVYKVWDKKVQELVDSKKLTTFKAESNLLYLFNCHSWHRGTKAVNRGWRWFGRLSWHHNVPARNEIRNQVQVYLDDPSEGW
jgi:hypothetical protein